MILHTGTILFSESSLLRRFRKDEIRRFAETGETTNPLGRDPGGLRFSIPGKDHKRHASGLFTGFDIGDLVPDHIGSGKIDPVFLCRPQQHPRTTFTAVALPSILPDPLDGMMGADVNTVDCGAVGFQHPLHVAVEDGHLLQSVVPSGHTGLVGDHDDQEAGLLQSTDRFGCPGDP